MGVPISTRDYQRHYTVDFTRCGPAALVRSLLPLKDGQASLQILGLSAASRLSFLVKILPRELGRQTAEEYDTRIKCRLASIIAGERAAEMGLSRSDEVCENPQEAKRWPFLGREAI